MFTVSTVWGTYVYSFNSLGHLCLQSQQSGAPMFTVSTVWGTYVYSLNSLGYLCLQSQQSGAPKFTTTHVRAVWLYQCTCFFYFVVTVEEINSIWILKVICVTNVQIYKTSGHQHHHNLKRTSKFSRVEKILNAMPYAVLVEHALVKLKHSLGYRHSGSVLRRMAESSSTDFDIAKNTKGKSPVSFYWIKKTDI